MKTPLKSLNNANALKALVDETSGYIRTVESLLRTEKGKTAQLERELDWAQKKVTKLETELAKERKKRIPLS